MKITIKKGDKTLVAPHFTAGEFFSHQPSKGLTSHDFYSELIEAVAYLRRHYGVAWRITSTYRPDSIGSQHRECRAVDSQDVDSGAGHGSAVMLDLVANLRDPNSEIFTNLRRIGITGFGVYDSFVHLDCRIVPGNHRDRFGSYAAWDDRSATAIAAAEAKKKALPSGPLPQLKKASLPKAPAVVTSPVASSSSPS